MSKTSDSAGQSPGDGKNAGHAAAEAITRKAGEVAEKVKEAGSKAAGYVQDKYEHMTDEARHAYQHARDKAYDWEHSLEEYVKARPLQSLIIAAGAGALLALLWKRRD